MFTGLVEGLAKLVALIPQPPGVRIELQFPLGAESESETIKLGDSISINGCCLTVVQIASQRISFEAGEETLRRTGLGKLVVGDLVNFERSLKVGDRMGGHFVTGHIDGQGTLVERKNDGDWSYFYFSAPMPLLLQMASKGSITINGVSLTLVDVSNERFSVALIPHTLNVTTLGALNVGDQVNLETDILAKYVQRISSGTAS